MNTEKIGFLEAIALITIVMINKIILNTPKDIIANTGTSSWLNAIYISIIAILVVLLISHLFKNFKGYDILDITKFVGGKYLKNIIGILYIILLIALVIYVLKNLTENLRIIYFRKTPLIYLLLFFAVSSTICNRFSLKSLVKANLIIAPIIFLSVIIILASSIKDFMPQRIFPILGYGIDKTFFSGLSNIFSFSGMLYLLFLYPFLDRQDGFKKISIIAIIISGIYLFLSVTCILLSLSFTLNSDEPFSLYVLTRNIEYGRFIQRVDALFILIWVISIISYINIPIYFALHIFKKITNVSDTKCINYTLNLFILALLLLPIKFADFTSVLNRVLQNYFFILFFAITFLILILANLKFRFLQKSRKDTCQTQ